MDVIAEIITYLKQTLNVPVSSEVPATHPARFVTVGRIGGADVELLSTPRVDIDTWGTSDLDASTIGETVKNSMFELMHTSGLISDVYRSSYYRSDVDGYHRYTGTYEITRNID